MYIRPISKWDTDAKSRQPIKRRDVASLVERFAHGEMNDKGFSNIVAPHGPQQLPIHWLAAKP
jgi:hypothetical protein